MFRERRNRLYRACTARGSVERRRELVEVLVEQVTVDTQREARGTVTESSLHVDRLPFPTDHPRCGAVSKRVHPNERQTEGLMGVAVVFGLTMESGDVDWVGIITAVAGAVMAITGLIRAFRTA